MHFWIFLHSFVEWVKAKHLMHCGVPKILALFILDGGILCSIILIPCPITLLTINWVAKEIFIDVIFCSLVLTGRT